MIPLIHLDQGKTEHLYEQIYSSLRDEIVSGRYRREEKLPSKRVLASSLQCSVNTVQSAYSQLVDEGYLIAREKSGYFVADLEGIVTYGDGTGEARSEPEGRNRYRYDFSYQGIDRSSFPLHLWRKLMKDVLLGDERDLLGSGDPKGDPLLRKSIAKYLRLSRGVECSPSRIIISSGTEFLLQLLVQLFDESTLYAIENPGYEKLSSLFRSARVEYRSIALDEQGILPEDLELSQADVVCITPSHQFPTGSIMPVGRRLQLLSWAQEKESRYIIEDDYDSEFRYAGKPIPSLQGLDQRGNVIYLGSFSKSLFPSLRISYLVLPEQLLDLYDERLAFTVCPVPLIEQRTLTRFIDEGHFERHLNRMRKLYRAKWELLVSSLRDAFPSSLIEGSPAGGHLVLRVRNGMSEQELLDRSEERGVHVYGMSRFYSSPLSEKDPAVLLGFAALSHEDISEAVQALRSAWAEGAGSH